MVRFPHHTLTLNYTPSVRRRAVAVVIIAMTLLATLLSTSHGVIHDVISKWPIHVVVFVVICITVLFNK